MILRRSPIFNPDKTSIHESLRPLLSPLLEFEPKCSQNPENKDKINTAEKWILREITPANISEATTVI
jgi:hypothetical protein